MTFDASALRVYVNGEFLSGSDARISIFDHGVSHGDGVFEGMRVFAGGLFRPEDHLARLERSAATLKIDLPLTKDELGSVIKEVVVGSGLREAHVRVILTRGYGAPGMNPWNCPAPSLIVTAYPFPPFLGAGSITAITSYVNRKAPLSIPAHVKSLNYLDGIIAKQQARACGADEALMLDAQGAVAEGTGSNVFAVVGDRLITPTLRAALPGITRMTILECAAELGIVADVRDVWPAELHIADAVFLTGSGAGVVGVERLDGYEIASEQNRILAALKEAYESKKQVATLREELFLERLEQRPDSQREAASDRADR